MHSMNIPVEFDEENVGRWEVYAALRLKSEATAYQIKQPHRKRIMVVDDDMAVRESLTEVLLSEGYDVLPAEDGYQALDILDKKPVDLVLLDLRLPKMDGWETARQLQRLRHTLPIVIVTACPNQYDRTAQSGAIAIMEKPLDFPQLISAIGRFLVEPTNILMERMTDHRPMQLSPPLGPVNSNLA
jgi:CheY-like chemotaxis protein